MLMMIDTRDTSRPELPKPAPAGFADGVRYAAHMLRHLRNRDGYQQGNADILRALDNAIAITDPPSADAE